MLPVVDYERIKRVYEQPSPVSWLPELSGGSLICLGIIGIFILFMIKRFIDTRRKYASSETEPLTL